MPVSANTGVYAEIGFNLWDADVSLSRPGFGSASISEDGSDLFYGIGAYILLSEAVNLNLVYQTHDLDDVDVEIDVLGLGFTLSF